MDDPRAWRRSDFVSARPWLITLPRACQEIIEQIDDHTTSITDMHLDDDPRLAGRAALDDAVHQLESGCGFVVLDRLPMDQMSVEQATLAFWLVGQMLGDPFAQNVRGTLLYDVRDAGGDYTKGARFSITNPRSSFHTDGAFNPRIADYVALLCLRTAASGGKNQLMSAYSLHNALRQCDPETLEALYQAFHFDRRGEFAEGEPPTTQTPVFDWNGDELTMRYLNYYIHEGHRLAGVELSAAQNDALNAVERLLEDEDLYVQFSLEPGQMLFANNHWTLHDRTAFVDHEDSDKRRHYVRLWLSRP